jgi:hypothetical protein
LDSLSNRPAPNPRDCSYPSANPFVALDRHARRICLAELEDLTGQLPPHPFVVQQRRQQLRAEGELLARQANRVGAQLGIFLDLEPRLSDFCQAVLAVMNALGRPWSRWENPTTEAYHELLRRIESCQQASAAVRRLADPHLPPEAVQDFIGAASLPPTWDELIQRLRDQLVDLPSDASDQGGGHAEGAGAAPDQGGTGQAEAAGRDEWVWAPDGDGYLVAGLGERGHFSRLKGLAMIEKLVRSPEQPVPMVLLMSGAAEQPSNDKRSKQPAMDEQALRDAHIRCTALRSELEQAEVEGRGTEAAEILTELEQLQGYIKAALGIGGKVRDLNDLANKLRPSIHAALARVYEAMRKAKPPMPELATHLESSISSVGPAFVYRLTSSPAPSWKTLTSGK